MYADKEARPINRLGEDRPMRVSMLAAQLEKNTNNIHRLVQLREVLRAKRDRMLGSRPPKNEKSEGVRAMPEALICQLELQVDGISAILCELEELACDIEGI
jgi:hypothetical protein